MLQYIFIGLELGAIYAIASASLVVTYVSAGVLNFAFAAMAYFVARVYYWLNSQHGWQTDTAGAVSILVVGPLLGIFLYLVLFRYIRGKSTLIKLVATIGLYVALPPVADLTMGTQTIDSAPGLASLSDKPYHFLGSPVTTDQIITYGFLLFIVVAGTGVLRFTDVGLKVRALVDSEAMASLSGTNPGRVAMGVWAVSATLAGVAGILVAPSQGLNLQGMTDLMAAAFAAVVVARLRSLPGAVAAALAMGLVTDMIQKYLPANSSFTADFILSIPFGFMFLSLVFYLLRSGSLDEDAGAAGPLDEAIKPAQQETVGVAVTSSAMPRWFPYTRIVPMVAALALPLILHGTSYWLGLFATGMCYALMFLTFTVVSGEGGMLWLSQIVFAGTGAMVGAQFVTSWHVPVLISIGRAAVVAAVAGALIGLLTIRLGDLYVALVTLTFGSLVDALVFTRNVFLQGGLGVTLNTPDFAHSGLVFSYLALAVFIVLALLTLNLRRSTSGLALRAVRDSEAASRTLGLSVVQVKVIAGALAAFVAAIGGGFFAMNQTSAQPTDYEVFAGLIWLAVVVSLGARSISAALIGGVSFSMITGVFASYVPIRWDEVPTLLFGLGAISLVRNPDGAIAQGERQTLAIIAFIQDLFQRGGPVVPASTIGAAAWVEPDEAEPPGQAGVKAETAP